MDLSALGGLGEKVLTCMSVRISTSYSWFLLPARPATVLGMCD